MPKQIISKAQAAEDPVVSLIKNFRTANKRAGEYIRLGDNINYGRMCERLQALANQATEEYGVAIWVNANGRTGHNHPMDYKETPDSDNDYGAHLLRQNRIDDMVARGEAPTMPESNGDGDSDGPDNSLNWNDDDNL